MHWLKEQGAFVLDAYFSNDQSIIATQHAFRAHLQQNWKCATKAGENDIYIIYFIHLPDLQISLPHVVCWTAWNYFLQIMEFQCHFQLNLHLFAVLLQIIGTDESKDKIIVPLIK